MQQKVKFNIFRDIINSISKFEKYEEFATCKLKNSILYSLCLILICSIIISMILTIKSISVAKKIVNEFKEQVYSVDYENDKLVINDDNLVEINHFQFINIIIDTSIDNTKDNNQEYVKNVENKENVIIFLKEECVIANFISNEVHEYNYKEMQKDGVEINKIFIDMLNVKEIDYWMVGIIIFLLFVFFTFVIEEFNFLLYAILFAIIGKITSIVLKVPLRFKENYNISTHALTLSTILQTIYILINVLLGFDIKYFYIMYMGVTDIYIITAILMIKTDLIKRKLEVDKIVKEQQNTKKEFEQWNDKLENKENIPKEIHKKENE